MFVECQGALGKEKQLLRRRVTETAPLPSVTTGDTRQINELNLLAIVNTVIIVPKWYM
jgi:hypothetical protein